MDSSVLQLSIQFKYTPAGKEICESLEGIFKWTTYILIVQPSGRTTSSSYPAAQQVHDASLSASCSKATGGEKGHGYIYTPLWYANFSTFLPPCAALFRPSKGFNCQSKTAQAKYISFVLHVMERVCLAYRMHPEGHFLIVIMFKLHLILPIPIHV